MHRPPRLYFSVGLQWADKGSSATELLVVSLVRRPAMGGGSRTRDRPGDLSTIVGVLTLFIPLGGTRFYTTLFCVLSAESTVRFVE